MGTPAPSTQAFWHFGTLGTLAPWHLFRWRYNARARRAHPMTKQLLRGLLVVAALLTIAAALRGWLVPASNAQDRGTIQSDDGGPGPGAAPDANDPANAKADLSPKPPVLPLSPAEEATRLQLPPGYRMQPVLSEPAIEDPAQVAFDGNGRMFVVELRGYF